MEIDPWGDDEIGGDRVPIPWGAIGILVAILIGLAFGIYFGMVIFR